MNAITEAEAWIDTELGRLYVKQWRDPTAGMKKPPIVLLHDALGSVALWRDFPSRLSQTTGRKVVAYDRLGFGESDPFPGKLGLRFIREEACGDFRALHSSLGLGDFIVLGHSVGGGMAIAIAATWPHASFCMEQTTSMAVVVKPSASHRSPRAARRSPTRKYPGMAADSGEQLEFPGRFTTAPRRK